jgi:hypothetical protein
MKMSERRTPGDAKVKREMMVRVVRDSRDSGMDYYLTYDRARQLFEERKLIQMQIYGGTWDFATRDKTKIT